MVNWDVLAVVLGLSVVVVLWIAWNVALFVGNWSWRDPIQRAAWVLVFGPLMAAFLIGYAARIQLSQVFVAVVAIWWPLVAVFNIRDVRMRRFDF